MMKTEDDGAGDSPRESGATNKNPVAQEGPSHMREEQLRRILDAVPALICYIDKEQRYRFNNKAYETRFGGAREEFYGKHLRDFLGDEAYQLLRPYVEAALSGKESGYEQYLPFADGAGGYFNVSYIPDIDEQGAVRGLVAFGSDLSERRRVEEALREAEQRAVKEYERLLERLTYLAETIGAAREHLTIFRALREFAVVSVPCIGIFISLYDERRDVRTAVYAWGDGEEADVSQLPPMPITSEGPNSRAVRTRQIVITDDYMNRKGPHPGVPVGPDNGLRPQSSLVAPMAVMGRIVGTIEVQSYERGAYRQEHLTAMRMAANLAAVALENMRLFEHERRARAAAEEANRIKDEFLATLSHELRTPLTAILGWANMLGSGKLDRAAAQNATEIIERNARAQQQIVDEILDVSRIITGKLRFNTQPMDLLLVVHAAIDAVRPAVNAKGIQLQTVFDPRVGPVMGDPSRLQQVVWNMLSNAVKFTPSGGRIELRVERAGEHARIIVRDTGIGIRTDFLPFVFDRFRQADQTTTRAFGGLGLGLAIVRHLVELHGGTVRAESGGENQGSTFTVELPLPALHAQESILEDERRAFLRDAQNLSTEERLPALVGLRILVVDDEADTLELISTILEQSGATVTGVASAYAALDALDGAKPDVIVSDIGMPGMDGNDLLRCVRERAPEHGGATPAIALTAYAGDGDRAMSLEAGFQKHVPKPIEPAALVAVIADLAGSIERDRKT